MCECVVWHEVAVSSRGGLQSVGERASRLRRVGKSRGLRLHDANRAIVNEGETLAEDACECDTRIGARVHGGTRGCDAIAGTVACAGIVRGCGRDPRDCHAELETQ